MRAGTCIVLCVGALLAGSAARAADLSKLERTIRKEPAYIGKPQYCLLVFGPRATQRVWLVIDANNLYVDRNGNGDLTDAGKRVSLPKPQPSGHPLFETQQSTKVGDITVGGLTHTDLEVNRYTFRRKVNISGDAGGVTPKEWQDVLDKAWRQLPDGLFDNVDIHIDPACSGLFPPADSQRVWHFAWVDDAGYLRFGDHPETAPILHFGGPLTVRTTSGDKLRHGEVLEKLTLGLGSRGVGPGSFVTMGYDLVPQGIHPVVEVQFPPKAAGEPTLTERYVLKERC
jgi:hypothetical protein